MDDSEIYALGGMTNSSKAMFERRRRILSVTTRMIETEGLEGFNIRALSDRAKVAPRTIYNAFGSKEGLMALAISRSFTRFHERIGYDARADTIEGVMDRWLTAVLRNLENRNFPRAVTALYFSPTAHPMIREAIEKLGANAFRGWFDRLFLERQLDRGVSVDLLARDMSNLQFAILHEWCSGSLSDEGLAPRLVESGLIHLSGVTRGAARTDVRAYLTDLRGDGGMLRDGLAKARDRIAVWHSRQAQASANHQSP
ncbi:MAG: TetR/AcrR family transcriptional regulator [Sphingobium sp.]